MGRIFIVAVAVLSIGAYVQAGVDINTQQYAQDSPVSQVQQIAKEAWEHYFPSTPEKSHLRAANDQARLATGLGVGFDPNTGVNKHIPVVSLKYSKQEVTIGDKAFVVPDGVSVLPSTGQHFPKKTSTVYPTPGDYVSALRSETLKGSTVAESRRSDTESGAVTGLDVQNLYDRFYKGPDNSLLAQELQEHVFFEAKVESDKLELDRFVLRAVDALPEEYDEAAYFEFIYWWGGLYTTSTKMGGVISLDARLKRGVTGAMTMEALRTNLRRDLVSQIDPSLSPTPPEAPYTSNKLENNIRMLGGIPDQAVDPAKYHEWLESVALNPIIIEASGGLISNLITNAKKAGNLSQAFNKVLSLEEKAGRSDLHYLQACEAKGNCHGAGSCLVTGLCACDSAHKGPDCAWKAGDRFAMSSHTTSLHFGDSYLSHMYRTIEGDVNGDGKTDLVRMGQDPTTLFVFISNGDGTYQESSQALEQRFQDGNTVTAFVTIQGDFNGDGKMDFLRMGQEPSVIFTYIGDGTGKFNVVIEETSLHFNDQARFISYQTVVGDFNGDKKTDFVRMGGNPTTFYHFFSNGDGTFTSGSFATTWNFRDGQAHPMMHLPMWVHGPRDLACDDFYVTFAGDVNGDGVDDIVRIGDSPSNAYILLSKKDGTWTTSQTPLCGLNFGDGIKKSYVSFVGDVNGDGKVDVVRMGAQPTTIHTLLSKGDGTFQCVSQPANGLNFLDGAGVDQYESFGLDFNGDGKMDVVRLGEDPTHAYLFESIGDGNFKFAMQDLAPLSFKDGQLKSFVTRKGSFDGTGIEGFVRIGQDPTVIYTARALDF